MKNQPKLRDPLMALVLGALVFGTSSLVVSAHNPQVPWNPFANFLTQTQNVSLASSTTIPLVLSAQENMVAQEILRRTTTLSLVQAVRTARVICVEAKRLGYDPLLFLAIIHVESSYDHLAVSSKGAEGLMQIMPSTARWMAARYDVSGTDTKDPVNNVRLGIRYVAYLHRHFHKMDTALAAYHRGPETIRTMLEENDGVIRQEIYDDYATKVLQRYRQLQKYYQPSHQS
jgi:soluble lytic murein transglycosylase